MERSIVNRRNLVVMATGTGKTVVAGLDYRRLREAGQVDSLLFVAHREEILGQSLSMFDVPEIDTVLVLRPTESATVFLQQLGRGLRLADDKPCLTVLDFIGNQASEFRFDLRYRALTGVSRRGLAREVEHGFPTLPPGCHIELDRVAADVVMRNVLASLRIDWRGLVAELRGHRRCSAADIPGQVAG